SSSACFSCSSSQPARSASCQRVWTTIIAPLGSSSDQGSSRVYHVEFHQSCSFARMVSDAASSAFLMGSSTTSRCAPLPVAVPPAPPPHRPPPCPVSQCCTPAASERIVLPASL